MIDVANGANVDVGLLTCVFGKTEDAAPEELVVAALDQLFQHRI